MKAFETIYKAALKKHGPAALRERLPKPKSARSLSATTDDRYLSAMAKCIFQAGFVWKVVENMWPGFEEVFIGFSSEALSGLEPKRSNRTPASSEMRRKLERYLTMPVSYRGHRLSTVDSANSLQPGLKMILPACGTNCRRKAAVSVASPRRAS